MIVSIFNDVIGPVMRGASSSHCAAALRIGRIARELMNNKIDHVLVEFDTAGSLPTTHHSQGSDMGLFGGLLGWDADDDRLADSAQWLDQAGIEKSFAYRKFGDPHPNTYRLTLRHRDTSRHLVAISTGGGMFEVTQIDGCDVSIAGDYDETLAWYDQPLEIDAATVRAALNADDVRIIGHESITLLHIRGQQSYNDASLSRQVGNARAIRVDRLSPVLPVRSRRNLSVPFQSCSEMLAYASEAEPGLPLWKLAVEFEMARSGLSEDGVVEKMCEIVRILQRSVQQGLEGTSYQDRILGPQAGEFKKAMDENRLLDTGILNRIVLYTTALMEVKSSMGVIVAAPTAGACAALPATCLATGEVLGLDEVEVARGMLAAGLIGVFIATHWSFAAETGGCQAEGGSAAAMAAAALVTFQGGTLAQASDAASMAMQNMLGLICDPVAGRVEVPCLGKNVMAASNAVSCANMALAGFDAVIPLDETIAAAKSVAERMPREHRCTALGGLAATATSLTIENRLRGCSACPES